MIKEKPSSSAAETVCASTPVDGAACGPTSCGMDHWQSRSEADWRQKLTPEPYAVAREAGTERAFTGKYWNTKTPGLYKCACCGQPLLRSAAKYESGTGWPSFHEPVKPQAVITREDRSHGSVRTAVKCARCDAHPGYVFTHGPAPTGLRYRMNSAVLNLAPDATTGKA